MSEREAWLQTLGGHREELEWELMRLRAAVGWPRLQRAVEWIFRKVAL